MRIPLVDLHAQYQLIKTEIDTAISRVIESSAFVMGEPVTRFEREFASYCQASYCISCGNGTDALSLTLAAFGIGRDDEVITTAHTFIATAEAITAVGAKVVFADVCDDTLLLDPTAVAAAVTPRTKAVVAVHLYGQLCDMDALLALAREKRILLIEDAAQAHGARRGRHRAGSCGDAAAFSFYPGKNLGAFGDGGAITTSRRDVAEWTAKARNHGRVTKYEHEFEGRNSRLDALQAAILSVKLRKLDQWNDRRRAISARYDSILRDRVRTIDVPSDSTPVRHLYVVRVPNRDGVLEALRARGIDAGIHYPVPLHLQRAYAYLGSKEGSLPITERAATQILSLPMYPELSDEQTVFIAHSLLEAVAVA